LSRTPEFFPVTTGKTRKSPGESRLTYEWLSIHEPPADAISYVDGGSDHVRVQVLTNAGALHRDKQQAVVAGLTEVITGAAGNPPPPERIWVLLTEAPDGGWGLWGRAYTNVDLLQEVRSQLAHITQVESSTASKDR
jgi:phenylpyruvate tautomerase PptA (4-oxalocrotonate tautomerase family)